MSGVTQKGFIYMWKLKESFSTLFTSIEITQEITLYLNTTLFYPNF